MLAGFHLHLLLCALDALPDLPDVDDGVAIHNESHQIVAVDIEDDGLVLLRDEGAMQLGREAFEVYARRKHGVTAIA